MAPDCASLMSEPQREEVWLGCSNYLDAVGTAGLLNVKPLSVLRDGKMSAAVDATL